MLVDRLDAAALADAVRRLQRDPPDPAACRASADRFREELFVTRIERVIDEERAAAAVAV
jgi:UDP:flavonoid glycosyltransferase YjiC (YdhE family)